SITGRGDVPSTLTRCEIPQKGATVNIARDRCPAVRTESRRQNTIVTHEHIRLVRKLAQFRTRSAGSDIPHSWCVTAPGDNSPTIRTDCRCQVILVLREQLFRRLARRYVP